MSQPATDGPRRRRGGAAAAGSTAADDGGRRRAGWLIPLLALLGLIVLGVVLWLVLRGRDDDPATASGATSGTTTATATGSATPTAGTSPSATPADSTGATAGTGDSTQGRLVAGGKSILPVPSAGGDLSPYTGTVTATAVTVQSVPADEGFWVGTSVTDRVWVQLTGAAGESPYTVKQGDKINFSAGRMVATSAGFAGKVGVDAAEGAAQLTAQRSHVEVAKSAIKLAP